MAEVARTIAGFEPVTMIVTPEAASVARAHCGSGIDLLEFPIDDGWIRDRVARSVSSTDPAGLPYLPYTEPIGGQRLAAPCTNFYPVNGAMIAPIVDDATGADAYHLLGELFPDRVVAPVPTHLQAYGGGGIGCVTQQVPAGPPLV